MPNSEIYSISKIKTLLIFFSFISPTGLGCCTGPLGVFGPTSPVSFFHLQPCRAGAPTAVTDLTAPPWLPPATSAAGEKTSCHHLLHSPIKQHTLSSFPLFISLVTGGIESLLHRWPLKATLHLRLPLNPIKGCPSRTLPHPTPYSLPHLSHQSALPLQVFACHHLPPSPGHLAVARSPVSGPLSSPCTTSPSPALGHRPRALEWP
jgi:hypothetical protein